MPSLPPLLPPLSLPPPLTSPSPSPTDQAVQRLLSQLPSLARASFSLDDQPQLFQAAQKLVEEGELPTLSPSPPPQEIQEFFHSIHKLAWNFFSSLSEEELLQAVRKSSSCFDIQPIDEGELSLRQREKEIVSLAFHSLFPSLGQRLRMREPFLGRVLSPQGIETLLASWKQEGRLPHSLSTHVCSGPSELKEVLEELKQKTAPIHAAVFFQTKLSEELSEEDHSEELYEGDHTVPIFYSQTQTGSPSIFISDSPGRARPFVHRVAPLIQDIFPSQELRASITPRITDGHSCLLLALHDTEYFAKDPEQFMQHIFQADTTQGSSSFLWVRDLPAPMWEMSQSRAGVQKLEEAAPETYRSLCDRGVIAFNTSPDFEVAQQGYLQKGVQLLGQPKRFNAWAPLLFEKIERALLIPLLAHPHPPVAPAASDASD